MSGRTYVVFYGILVALRLAVALGGNGYVHPDAFFQSGEIFARLKVYPELSVSLTNSTREIPWEWRSDGTGRSRSVAPMLVMVALPQLIHSWTAQHAPCIILFERAWMFLLSLFVDYSFYDAARRLGSSQTAFLALCIFGASWPWMVLSSMTLTNVLELSVFVLLMRTILVWEKTHNTFHAASVGALAAFGCFSRFTFPVFSWPLAVLWIYRGARGRELVAAVSGATAVAACCTFIDTLWYHDDFKSIFLLSWWTRLLSFNLDYTVVIAPLNNLVYNLNSSNLALHGIHPRWTHVLLNVPILFGGPTIPFLSLFAAIRKALNAPTAWQTAILSTIISGITLLSVAPHQEPRFLLPLLPSFSLLTASFLEKSKSWYWIQLVCMCAAGTLFFGFLHQAGVVPAMCDAGLSSRSQASSPTHLLFYRTYMPPIHALAGREPSSVRIHDAGGSSQMLQRLVSELASQCAPTWIATPGAESLDYLGVALTQVASLKPHISMESPFSFRWDQMGLNVYAVHHSCT